MSEDVIDHTLYVVVYIEDDSSNCKDEEYKSIKVDKATLLFIPLDEIEEFEKEFQGKHKIITISWSIMRPVLETLLNEDWDSKFENDEDSNALEDIDEEANEPEVRLDEIEEFFKRKYQQLKGNPDPIIHTYLIVTPIGSDSDFVFYFGEKVELQNNRKDDIEHLFALIMEQYKKQKSGEHEQSK
jgi:hypothetical protein